MKGRLEFLIKLVLDLFYFVVIVLIFLLFVIIFYCNIDNEIYFKMKLFFFDIFVLKIVIR